MQLGDILKKLRENKNLTQEQMSIILDITQQAYQKYESNERKPKYDTLLKISRYFNVSTDYLLNNIKHINETKIMKLEKELDEEEKRKLYEMCELMFTEKYKKIKDE